MNTKKFSEAMSEIDDKYVEEAISYSHKAKAIPNRRRLSVALIAAILALLLIGAGVAAIIYGDSIQNWFEHYWEVITGQQMSDEQAATIDHLSQEIELSQTVGDVTVTVDSATIGYDNFFLLLRLDGLELSDRYGYGFENIIMNVEPDPVLESNGIGSYGFQYHGRDGDGAALLRMEYSYASGIGNNRDTRPIDITLKLENFLQNTHTGNEKVLAEGKWNFNFSLDRSKPIDVVQLPDTKVMAMDLGKQELVPVTISNLELTSTGLNFQYDYNKGSLSIEAQIDVILDNGQSVGCSGSNGTPLEDGETLNCSYQWRIPVNLKAVSCIQIGETQISIPSS